jgi:hypothetical protein
MIRIKVSCAACASAVARGQDPQGCRRARTGRRDGLSRADGAPASVRQRLHRMRTDSGLLVNTAAAQRSAAKVFLPTAVNLINGGLPAGLS